jgi:hypothetical protein
MDALNPKPDPTPTPAVEAVAPAAPTGPICGTCGDTAVVNWRRRLTGDELAEHVRLEQERREQALLLADKQLPSPVFPPLPDGSDDTRTVYACAEHAITMDDAALVHEARCTAPNEDGMRGCDCTAEAPPEAASELPPALALPDHWLTGT